MDARTAAGHACIVVGSVVAVVATVLVVQRSLAGSAEPEDLMSLGEERLRAGDLRGARDWFRKASGQAPGANAPLTAQARVLELLGQTDSALEAYREAAAAEPEELGPGITLARALGRAGRRAEAEEELSRLRARQPTSPEPLVELAALVLEAGDLEAALEAYRELRQLAPDDVRGPLGEAAILESRGERAEARRAYEAATAADRASAPAWEGLGRTAAAASDLAAAERAYGRVVELRRDDPSALVVLATLVEGQARYEEASGLFRRALSSLGAAEGEARATRALAWTGLGTCLLALGRRDEAYEALASALTDEPDQAEALWALAPIYLDRGELEPALRALRRVVPRRGDEPMLWVLMGRAEAGQGRWEEARSAFRHALELDRDHLEARRWLGISLRVLGAYRAAAATLEEVVRERPEDGLARLNLAIALGQLGELARARRELASARRLLPGEAEPLYQEAHLLLAAGDARSALPLARQAVALAPDAPGALEVLARALEASGLHDEARGRAAEALEHAEDDAQRQYLRELVSRLAGRNREPS